MPGPGDPPKEHQFKMGHAKIPGSGRPRGLTLSQCLRKISDEIDPETGKLNVEVIAEALVKKAKRGWAKHIEVFRDTSEGKPVERIRVSKGPDESHITDQELESEMKRLTAGKQIDAEPIADAGVGQGEIPAPPSPPAIPGNA